MDEVPYIILVNYFFYNFFWEPTLVDNVRGPEKVVFNNKSTGFRSRRFVYQIKTKVSEMSTSRINFIVGSDVGKLVHESKQAIPTANTSPFYSISCAVGWALRFSQTHISRYNVFVYHPVVLTESLRRVPVHGTEKFHWRASDLVAFTILTSCVLCFTICFTICLCISPDLDGNRGTKNETLWPDCPDRDLAVIL
jgi:hypothetical protein